MTSRYLREWIVQAAVLGQRHQRPDSRETWRKINMLLLLVTGSDKINKFFMMIIIAFGNIRILLLLPIHVALDGF